jgi:hypothetical protein
MRLQREHNKLRDGEDIEVRQAKRYRTHDINDDDGNNSHDGHTNDNDNDNDDGLPVVMDGAKIVIADKEDFDRDNEKHNGFNNNYAEKVIICG